MLADPTRDRIRQNLVRAYLQAGEKEKAQEQLELLMKRQNIE